MADKKTSDETAASTLTGAELIRGVQGGASVKVTVDQIRDYVQGALTALVIATGTITTSTPAFSATQTWNNSGVTFTAATINVTDTASASASKLLDAQIDGVSQFYVRKNGIIVATTRYEAGGNPGQPSSTVGDNVSMMLTSTLGWTNTSNALNTVDTVLRRDAANTLALQNGTSAQAFNVYNTWSSAGANYERLALKWSSNIVTIGTEAGGTGSSRGMVITAAGNLYLGGGGVVEWQISSSGNFVAYADATYDIGASGANRPRNAYLSGTITVPAIALGSTSAALKVGTHSAIAAETVTGYITIKDSGGTDRKIAVVS